MPCYCGWPVSPVGTLVGKAGPQPRWLQGTLVTALGALVGKTGPPTLLRAGITLDGYQSQVMLPAGYGEVVIILWG